jgi:PPR repeat
MMMLSLISICIHALVIHSYASAISACGESYEHALLLLSEMKAHSIPLTVVAVNSAIHACAQSGQLQQALWLLSDLKDSATLKPDLLSYR